MKEDHSDTINRIMVAIRSHDKTSLEAVVGEFARFNFKNPVAEGETFPEDVFAAILNLFEQPTFLEMNGSYHLLLLFEYDWSTLNQEQKTRLLEALRKAYGKFRDWMSPFVITELLGQHYCDSSAFKVLMELENSSNEVARSLVPHAYEHVVKEGGEQQLREQAMSRLLSMKNDASEMVRNEVEVALRNAT
jgi:hypothetical protein